MEFVTLHSQDGQDFQVDVELAQMSGTIKDLFEDIGFEYAIPLPNIEGKVLSRIIELSTQLKDEKELVIVERDRESLNPLLMAANYLAMEKLLDLLNNHLVTQMGVGVDKIRNWTGNPVVSEEKRKEILAEPWIKLE